MLCPNCGQPNPDSASNCSKCGSSFRATKPYPGSTPSVSPFTTAAPERRTALSQDPFSSFGSGFASDRVPEKPAGGDRSPKTSSFDHSFQPRGKDQESYSESDAGKAYLSGGFEGVVQNFQTEEDMRPGIVRWFAALFRGAAYASSKRIHHFQLITEVEDGYPQGREAVIFGDIAGGYIHDGDRVSLVGSESGGGTIYVTRATNLTTNSILSVRGRVPKALLWAVTGILVFFVVMILVGLSGINTHTIGGMFASLIILIIFLLILKTWLGSKFRRRR